MIPRGKQTVGIWSATARANHSRKKLGQPFWVLLPCRRSCQMVNAGSYLLILEPPEILPRFNSTLSRPGRAVTPSDASTAALGQQPTVLLRTTNGSNERLTCRTLEHRLHPRLAGFCRLSPRIARFVICRSVVRVHSPAPNPIRLNKL